MGRSSIGASLRGMGRGSARVRLWCMGRSSAGARLRGVAGTRMLKLLSVIKETE